MYLSLTYPSKMKRFEAFTSPDNRNSKGQTPMSSSTTMSKMNPFARKPTVPTYNMKQVKCLPSDVNKGDVIRLPTEQNVIITDIRYADEHMTVIGTPLLIFSVKGYGGVFNNVETEFSIQVDRSVFKVGDAVPLTEFVGVTNDDN